MAAFLVAFVMAAAYLGAIMIADTQRIGDESAGAQSVLHLRHDRLAAEALSLSLARHLDHVEVRDCLPRKEVAPPPGGPALTSADPLNRNLCDPQPTGGLPRRVAPIFHQYVQALVDDKTGASPGLALQLPALSAPLVWRTSAISPVADRLALGGSVAPVWTDLPQAEQREIARHDPLIVPPGDLEWRWGLDERDGHVSLEIRRTDEETGEVRRIMRPGPVAVSRVQVARTPYDSPTAGADADPTATPPVPAIPAVVPDAAAYPGGSVRSHARHLVRILSRQGAGGVLSDDACPPAGACRCGPAGGPSQCAYGHRHAERGERAAVRIPTGGGAGTRDLPHAEQAASAARVLAGVTTTPHFVVVAVGGVTHLAPRGGIGVVLQSAPLPPLEVAEIRETLVCDDAPAELTTASADENPHGDFAWCATSSSLSAAGTVLDHQF